MKSTVGTPQDSILSPLLSNIVLDLLDKFMVDKHGELNVGSKRKLNRTNTALENRRKYYKTRDPALAHPAILDMRRISKLDMNDMSFRRSLFIRYADDFIVLLANSRENAERLKQEIADFLWKVCGLELNQDKTTIVNTREGFMFLGAKIKRRTNISIFNSYVKNGGGKITRRSTVRMGVDAPIETLITKLVDHGFARRNHLRHLLVKGKTNLVHLTHFDIIRFFNSKITGLLSAYSFAGNFSEMNKITWILRQSCALTLARKFKLKTMKKAFATFGFDLMDPLTDVKLNIPKTFKAQFNYKLNNFNLTQLNDLEDITDKILAQSCLFFYQKKIK